MFKMHGRGNAFTSSSSKLDHKSCSLLIYSIELQREKLEMKVYRTGAFLCFKHFFKSGCKLQPDFTTLQLVMPVWNTWWANLMDRRDKTFQIKTLEITNIMNGKNCIKVLYIIEYKIFLHWDARNSVYEFLLNSQTSYGNEGEALSRIFNSWKDIWNFMSIKAFNKGQEPSELDFSLQAVVLITDFFQIAMIWKAALTNKSI